MKTPAPAERRGHAVLLLASTLTTSCSLFPDTAPMQVQSGDGGAGGRMGAGGAAGAAGAESGGARGDGGDASAGGAANSGGGGTAPLTDSGSGGGTVTPPEASPDTGTDTDASLEGGSLVSRLAATVVDCLEQGRTNPDECRTVATTRDGPNVVWVDIRSGADRHTTGYLRFDVGSALSGRTVLSALVEVTVASYALSSGSAPELWEVVSFDRAALFTRTPALAGTSPLATVPGTLSTGATARYALSPVKVEGATTLYLALVPVRADGVSFWNLDGPSPPTLVVTHR